MKGMGRIRPRVAVVTGVCALLYLGLLLLPTTLRCLGRFLDVSRPLKGTVDYVFVLGGGADTRPFVAAEIIRANRAQKILIPQTTANTDVASSITLPHHQILKNALLASGVRNDQIILLPLTVDSTADEARSLTDFLSGKPPSKVALVTSNFHTRRTGLLFQRIPELARHELQVIGAPTDGFGPTDWYCFEDGWVTYGTEFAKLLRDSVHF